MSATTEMLVEQINQIKERMASARRSGQDTRELENQCSELSNKLNVALNSLNEGKQILKG
jgi:hypothetical protein